MKVRNKWLVIFLIGGCCSCSFLKAKVGDPVFVPQPSMGKIYQPAILAGRGKVLVVPFSPGPRVAATDELERMALSLVKGIAQQMSAGGFEVLSAQEAQDAELILKGRITARVEKSGWWRSLLRKNRKELAVEAQLVTVDQRLIVQVATCRASRDKTKVFAKLAEELGEMIGQFLSEKKQ